MKTKRVIPIVLAAVFVCCLPPRRILFWPLVPNYWRLCHEDPAERRPTDCKACASPWARGPLQTRRAEVEQEAREISSRIQIEEGRGSPARALNSQTRGVGAGDGRHGGSRGEERVRGRLADQLEFKAMPVRTLPRAEPEALRAERGLLDITLRAVVKGSLHLASGVVWALKGGWAALTGGYYDPAYDEMQQAIHRVLANHPEWGARYVDSAAEVLAYPDVLLGRAFERLPVVAVLVGMVVGSWRIVRKVSSGSTGGRPKQRRTDRGS